MNYTVGDISKLGTILGIWAHPDDECWIAGGLLASALEAGQRVVCVTATHGDAGKNADQTSTPLGDLGGTRHYEELASLQILGGAEHRWLDYLDGQLSRANAKHAVRQLAAIITEVQPDVVITFGPDGLTGHMDHRTVSVWAKQALARAKSPAELWYAVEEDEKYRSVGKRLHDFANIYFATHEPFVMPAGQADVHFDLPTHIWHKKIAALRAHKSQTAHIFADEQAAQWFCDYMKCECFMRAQR